MKYKIRYCYKQALKVEPNLYPENYIRVLISKNIIPRDENLRDNIIIISKLLKLGFTYEDIKKAVNFYATGEVDDFIFNGILDIVNIQSNLKGYDKVKAERQAKAVILYCFFKEALKKGLWRKDIIFKPTIKIKNLTGSIKHIEILFDIKEIEKKKTISNTLELGQMLALVEKEEKQRLFESELMNSMEVKNYENYERKRKVY